MMIRYNDTSTYLWRLCVEISDIVSKFEMQPHPEGGYFLETYRSDIAIKPESFEGERSCSTGIYFLIEKDNFSAFHRIKSDEMWHFYAGNPLEVVEITPDGELKTTTIGNDILNGEVPQYVVKKDRWFASYCKDNEGFSFVGCTVSPGFDFSDFELASRDELINSYPRHAEVIKKLTRS